jgi:hypothetical protein
VVRRLHDTLRAHPFLTELMTIADRESVTSYVDDLLRVMILAGLPRSQAVECCRALVTVTIKHTIIEGPRPRTGGATVETRRSPSRWRAAPEISPSLFRCTASPCQRQRRTVPVPSPLLVGAKR